MREESLDSLTDEGMGLLNGQNPVETHSDYERWVNRVCSWLAKTAPNSGLAAEWASLGRSPLVQGGSYYDQIDVWMLFQSIVQKRLEWLSTLPLKIGTSSNSPSKSNTTPWDLIHPKICEVAKTRLESGHYADAVEASLKEVNVEVKKIVKGKLPKDLDGAALMNYVFSPSRPIALFGDLNTETGKNIQNGYMQIFAGAMTGIRNPKAHENVQISMKQAIHHIFLASLLMTQLDTVKLVDEIQEPVTRN